MNPKKIITGLLVVFALASIGTVIVREFIFSPTDTKSTEITPQAIAKGKKLVVYYFHGNQRCRTCKTIESYTREAVNSFNAADSIEIITVNVDDKANEHFIKDYMLSNRSVVLSKTKDSKELEWKRLDKVWNLVGNKEKFLSYVKEAIKSLRKKKI